MSFKRIALVILALNVLAIDVVTYRFDSAMREVRSIVCERTKPDPPPTKETGFLFVTVGRGETSMISIDFRSQTRRMNISLYGCDANGHQYRMWVRR